MSFITAVKGALRSYLLKRWSMCLFKCWWWMKYSYRPTNCQAKVVLIWLIQHAGSFFLCYLFVGQSKPAHLSTKGPQLHTGGEKLIVRIGRSDYVKAAAVDSSWVEGSRGAFPQKPPYGSHQCGCENWDFSLLLLPPHSLSLSLSLSTPLWDALPPQYNLGADKGSGATEQVSHYNVLGERESWNKVNIRARYCRRMRRLLIGGPSLPQEAAESMKQLQEPQ